MVPSFTTMRDYSLWMVVRGIMAILLALLSMGITAPFMARADVSTTSLSVRLAQCADGIDNDGDGLIDYPLDPDCTSALDDDEASPVTPTPECADGVDNDGDSLIDYPSDSGCSDATDDDERNTVIVSVPGGGAPPSIITLPRLPQQPEVTNILRVCDLNADNRCDLIDLSILLYYFDHPVPPGARQDFNRDGKVDLIDVSILFYYWV